MTVLFVLGIFVAVAAVISLIMPWISLGRIKDLEWDILELKSQLKALRIAQQEQPQQTAEVESFAAKTPPITTAASQPQLERDDPVWQATDYFDEPEETLETPVAAKPKKQSLEQQFGAKLPVWIGGIALALAGFFMVKYSIDTGLLNETVRVVLGGTFGLGLLYAGHVIFKKPSISNGTRIAQSLVGAGIADLYACLFAATSLYHLLPSYVGFAGMAIVTAYAVVASLRYGAPIALLGLAGGFLTPAFIHSSEPSAPLLFLYLYFVLAGMFAVIRSKGWWLCGVLAVAASFLWVAVWLIASPLDGETALWVGLFLLAVSATVVGTTRSTLEEIPGSAHPIARLNYLTLGGAALLMAVTVTRAQFDLTSWGLFGLLTVAGLGLAWFKPRIYSFVPWMSLALSLLMLAAWHDAAPSSLALTILAFSGLYIVCSYYFLWHSDRPVLWAALGAGAALTYYLLGYYELRTVYNRATIGFPFWGLMGLVLAAFTTQIVWLLRENFKSDEPTQQKLMAIYASAATAFLSLALSIELPRDFLPVVFATEVFAISLIDSKVKVDALRWIALAASCVFALLLIPQMILLLQLTAYSLFEMELPLQASIPIVNWPLFQLGIPAAAFAGASFVLRQSKDDRFVKGLEAAAIALLGLMGYYLTRHLFHAGENVLFSKASFGERGTITNVLFVYGIICLLAGRYLNRNMISRSGLILCAIALFRIVYFDLLIYNPLWSHQLVGEMPIVNSLLVTYGLPIFWLAVVTKELPSLGKSGLVLYSRLAALIMGFALVTMTVSQFYHGAYLDGAATGNAEVYSYSLAWLLLGIGMLIVGTARHDKMLRSASLAVLLLTIGKVFLYDAAQLSGLYRIFSFLGLGISLLGLSWFYTRFVFVDRRTESIQR